MNAIMIQESLDVMHIITLALLSILLLLLSGAFVVSGALVVSAGASVSAGSSSLLHATKHVARRTAHNKIAKNFFIKNLF